jgi:predicted transcriptional regulator
MPYNINIVIGGENMSVKEIRLQTGMSQNKFAEMFTIPVSTLRDWEQGRRTPSDYVVNMMQKILELQGYSIDEKYIEACERRKASVEKAIAILLTATDGLDDVFLNVLDSYIAGLMTLSEIEARVDRLEYIYE